MIIYRNPRFGYYRAIWKREMRSPLEELQEIKRVCFKYILARVLEQHTQHKSRSTDANAIIKIIFKTWR